MALVSINMCDGLRWCNVSKSLPANMEIAFSPHCDGRIHRIVIASRSLSLISKCPRAVVVKGLTKLGEPEEA